MTQSSQLKQTIFSTGQHLLRITKNWSPYLFFIGFLLNSTPAHNACGPMASSHYFNGYSFISEDVLRTNPPISAFYLHFESMAVLERRNKQEQIIDNVQEWTLKVCENALPDDVANLIYNTPIDVLRQLRTSIQSKSIQPPIVLSGNTFVNFLYRHKCIETVEYLIFAKECEPHVTSGGDPWSEATRNIEAMEELIDSGKQAFRKTDSDYIKLRYAFQLVRLAHYAGKYQEALDLFDFAIPKIDMPQIDGKPSLIYYWLLGHKAGAILKLGDNIQASYLYSKIFAECPSKRQSAFRSFSIKSDAEWEALLLLCRNKNEEATLYGLRAHDAGSNALLEMEKIYQLAPEHDILEILLLREIKALEQDLLGLDFNDHKRSNQRNFDIPRPFAGTYVISMHDFAHQLWTEEKVANPALWHLAEGYLELLSSDYYAAAKTFQEVKPKLTSKELIDQLEVFMVALEISSFEEATPEVEERAYYIWKDENLFRKYPDFSDFLRDKLVQLYSDNNRPGKAFLARHTLDDLRPNPQDNILDDLQLVPGESERTPIERLLFRDAAGADIVSDLYDMEATLLMQDFQMEAALQLYKKIPRPLWDTYGSFDPFRGSFMDCISCPHSKDTADLYNRGELLEELLDLEYKARAEPVNSAVYYYKLGTAYYNMTYFGHSWNTMDYFRSGASWYGVSGNKNVFSCYGCPFGNKENMDVSRALYFFEKSRLMAMDPELQARASFMASKCELIQYYQSKDFQPVSRGFAPVVPPAYRVNFQFLVDNFEDTEFFEELIEECSYFRLFVGE